MPLVLHSKSHYREKAAKYQGKKPEILENIIPPESRKLLQNNNLSLLDGLDGDNFDAGVK